MNVNVSGSSPFLVMAPMDGVVDWTMRHILSNIGGMDLFITEFLRVTHALMPKKNFYEICPELLTDSKTSSGTPVFLQLLGSDVELMAAHATRAEELGAMGIDLNFGCPAKTVNRHEGGAVLLKTPDRIFKIVDGVRKAVSPQVPVTVKMRLGFEDASLCIENARAIASAGASWLTVHCRTRMDGYRPPAYWEWIPKIQSEVSIPLIVNGEIWSLDDFERCRNVTGAQSYMLGRGALSRPTLFKEIKSKCSEDFRDSNEIYLDDHLDSRKLKWLRSFHDMAQTHVNSHFAMSRSKQWLKNLAIGSLYFENLFNKMKIILDPIEFAKILETI